MGCSMQAEDSESLSYKRFHLKPHPDRNSGYQRLRFTFNRSLLIQTTCNMSPLLQRFRWFFLFIANMFFIANVAFLYVGKLFFPLSMKSQRLMRNSVRWINSAPDKGFPNAFPSFRNVKKGGSIWPKAGNAIRSLSRLEGSYAV